MKKKTIISLLFIVLVIIASFLIPVKTEEVWVNDSEIADVGHYEVHHSNIYGFTIIKEEK